MLYLSVKAYTVAKRRLAKISMKGSLALPSASPQLERNHPKSLCGHFLQLQTVDLNCRMCLYNLSDCFFCNFNLEL